MRTRLACGLAIAALCLLLPTRAASAHPLGNLTTNTSSHLAIHPDRIDADIVLDLAEIPTVAALQVADVDKSGDPSQAELDRYRDQRCHDLTTGFHLRSAVELNLSPVSASLELLPGQAGLQTLRLTCLSTVAAPTAGNLTIEDTNMTDRIGWREITASAEGMQITTDLAGESSSNRLRQYPVGVATLRILSGSIAISPGSNTVATPISKTAFSPPSAGLGGLNARFSSVIGRRHLTLPFALVGCLLALLLGAVHSLAPGHGKTLMAAYVVARRGATRHVLTIGITVAITHTAGVLLLGTLIWGSQALAPERILPWLAVASGALIAGTGVALLIRRIQGRELPALLHGHHHTQGHDHGHDDGHGHDHHPHAPAVHGHDHHDHAHDDHGHDHHEHNHHEHDHHDHHDLAQETPNRRWLMAMGVAGGLVPTPSALVVLLGATALGRPWFGVVLVAVYGVGMALTLMAAGVALVRLQSWVEAHWNRYRSVNLAIRWLPAVTAVMLIGAGLLLVGRSIASL